MRSQSWTDPDSGVTYMTGGDPLRTRLVDRCRPILGRHYATVWTWVTYPKSGPRYVMGRIMRRLVCSRRGHRGYRILNCFCRRCGATIPPETFDVGARRRSA